METVSQKVLQAYIAVRNGNIRFQKQAAEVYGVDRRLVSYLGAIKKHTSEEDFEYISRKILKDDFVCFTNKERSKSLEVIAKYIKQGEKLSYSSAEYTAVYVLKSDMYYKIGVASAITKRIGMLQVGNPHLIELVHQTYFNSQEEAFSYEKELHTQFRDKHHMREWFLLDLEDIRYLKDENAQ